jgi:hypothetical protein
VFVAGLSLEGREIRGIRITGPGADKPAVLVNSCQHAREWPPVMVNMYAADRLIAEYDLNPTVKGLVDDVEFFVIPIVNPDGYVYTWGPDRWWRKNRRDNGDGTWGVDLNRNWDYQWGYDNNGSDPNPDGETYRGTAPFSEPETQVMRDFYQANPQIVANIDLHTQGNLILYPWGYDYVPAPDAVLMDNLGEIMEASIYAVHGEVYTNQQAVVLYPGNGISIDWTYGDQGVFSYTFELRNHDLPPAEIILNCQEIFPAVLDIAEFTTQGVQFSFPSGLPEIVEADLQTAVQVEITAITASLEPGTAKLIARVGPSGPFSESALAGLGNDQYQGLLPAAPCDEVVQFYFQVQTTDAVVHYSPDDAPASYYEATAFDITVSFADDFETDQGWTAENLGASSGDWQRGVPVDDPGWEYDPASDGDGSGQAFLTQNQTGNTDVDGGAVRLTSPVFDMTDSNVSIAYEYFLRLTDTGGGVDRLLVEMSGNGDIGPWIVVATHDTDGGLLWRHHEMTRQELEATGLVLTANMKTRFTANDADPQSIVEAGVDGVVVKSLACEPDPCPWDLDGSGDVGVTDFLEMLAVWGQSGVPADFDGDGVSVTDFLILLGNWGPCP